MNRSLAYVLCLASVVLPAACSHAKQTTARIVRAPDPQRDVSLSRGAAVFAANCSVCHGATGHEGGVGPSLTHESRKMNLDTAIAWIKNPASPMPKLYPSPLSEQDVVDVAAYVESL